MKTKDDYWNIVDKWWDQILEMASDHLDLSSLAHETPGKEATPLTGRTILEEMNFLKRARSEKLPRYFHAIWCLASDAYAYSKPGWGQLCDLCSEEHLIYEDEERGE